MRAPATAGGQLISCPCGSKISVPASNLQATRQNETNAIAQRPIQKIEAVAPVSSPLKSRDNYSHTCACGRSLRVIRGDKAKKAKCLCGLLFDIPPKELDKVLVLRPVEKPVYLSDDQLVRNGSPFNSPLDLPSAPTYLPPAETRSHTSTSRQNPQVQFPSHKSVDRQKTDQPKLFGSSTIYGGAMMLGAVVWFVAGLFVLDRIFIYPPVMFVLGLIGFVKGLVNGS